MAEDKPMRSTPPMAREVEADARRKLKARRHQDRGVWFGLGMMGLVGWSVVVPTLLGAAIGAWLDRNHAGRQSWTLTLLVAGLVLGYVQLAFGILAIFLVIAALLFGFAFAGWHWPS